MNKLLQIPTTFVGYSIIVNDRQMIWQNNVIYTGYCYIG